MTDIPIKKNEQPACKNSFHVRTVKSNHILIYGTLQKKELTFSLSPILCSLYLSLQCHPILIYDFYLFTLKFLKNLLHVLNVCCMCLLVCVCTTLLWGRKMPSGPMELQSVVSHPMWVLGSKPSAKGTSACNYWAISPASHKKCILCVWVFCPHVCVCTVCMKCWVGAQTRKGHQATYQDTPIPFVSGTHFQDS